MFWAAYWPQEGIDSAENNRSFQSIWGNVDTANEREATACLEAFSANAELKKKKNCDPVPLRNSLLPEENVHSLPKMTNSRQAVACSLAKFSAPMFKLYWQQKYRHCYSLLVLTWDWSGVGEISLHGLLVATRQTVSQRGKALVWSVYFQVYLYCSFIASYFK